MSINSDISVKVVVHAHRQKWRRDTRKKSEILYLDLLDTVKPVATYLMRMRRGAMLPPELLAGGKEILVLDGTFQNERGDYPAGSYIRLPPGSKQEPYSESGCLLFVKTWQFEPTDRHHVNIDAYSEERVLPRTRLGVMLQPLYGDRREDLRIEHWEPNHHLELTQCNGLEVLVLNGTFHEPSTSYQPLSWLRLPPGKPLRLVVDDEPVRVLIKESHLVHAVPGRPASNLA